MCPMSDVVLYQAGNAGGAWRIQQFVGIGEIEDSTVRIDHRPVDERKRVADLWVSFALEGFHHILHSDLCGNLSIVVTTHTISDYHQQRIARITMCQSILVIFTLTESTFLVDGEFHLGSAFLLEFSYYLAKPSFFTDSDWRWPILFYGFGQYLLESVSALGAI